MDGPSEVEPRQPEDVVICAVGLLKEDGCCVTGVSKVAYDLQFGGGEALDVELKH